MKRSGLRKEVKYPLKKDFYAYFNATVYLPVIQSGR